MRGFGGRYYWGRREKERERERESIQGIVVVFAWMSSQERQLRSYVDLYFSLRWISLICHSQFLNLFFPDKATSLAIEILNQLVQELKVRPCPVVFASFSGGPKACMYKVLQDQIIEVKCEAQVNQRMGAPYLILCSEDDDLAPCQVICNFSQRLQDLGGDVKLVKWKSSPHVGHYRRYPTDYKAAVTDPLGKAAIIYSRRVRQLEGERMGFEGTHDEVSKPLDDLRKVAASSNQSFQKVSLEWNNQFVGAG